MIADIGEDDAVEHDRTAHQQDGPVFEGRKARALVQVLVEQDERQIKHTVAHGHQVVIVHKGVQKIQGRCAERQRRQIYQHEDKAGGFAVKMLLDQGGEHEHRQQGQQEKIQQEPCADALPVIQKEFDESDRALIK